MTTINQALPNLHVVERHVLAAITGTQPGFWRTIMNYEAQEADNGLLVFEQYRPLNGEYVIAAVCFAGRFSEFARVEINEDGRCYVDVEDIHWEGHVEDHIYRHASEGRDFEARQAYLVSVQAQQSFSYSQHRTITKMTRRA